MARHRRRRRGSMAALALVALASLVVLAGVGWRLAARATGVTTTTTTTTTTTVPPPTTTTTVPVGSLPQTTALPPATTPSLTRRVRALVVAVAQGSVRLGLPAFFPVAAYVQTKAYADAAHDWATRLIPEYAGDIEALHRELDPGGAPMRLLGYAVDDGAAEWVLPGEEFNKGPYWRVYDTVVAYGIGAHRGTFTVNTMISWRGQWYVTHIASFNS